MKPYRFLKRAIDIGVSTALLVVGAPFLLVAAIAVRLTSPGPVLFRQTRVGLDGAPFTMLKFRTMKVNAPDLRNSDGTTFNAADDPRLTPVGGFLRRTSIDELPQLINVLRGDMSLVGGRPDLPEGVTGYLPHQHRRLAVRPGMTGWAIVHGRNQVPLQQRRDLDAWYADNYSLALDIRIMYRTALMVLGGVGVINDYSKGVSGPDPKDESR
jgi:undecaprenyl phosphate N,N'-diacetylbacillosamine 1-phosphate transferase